MNNGAVILGANGKPIISDAQKVNRKRILNSGLSNGAAVLDNASLANWNWWGGSSDDDITQHLSVVRQRCRDLALNEPIVASIVNTLVTNVVGRGIIPDPAIDKEYLGLSDEQATKLQKDILRHWEYFAESTECDIRRRDDFYNLQQLAFRSAIESGDVFAALVYQERAGSNIDLRIQLIEADCIDNPNLYPANDYKDKDVFGGVEVDEYGAVVAYYVATQHPLSRRKHGLTEWVRVPAYGEETGRRNILHIMRSQRPGQRRGISILAPVVVASKILSRYQSAALQAALVQTLLTAVIKTQSPQSAVGEFNAMMTPPAGVDPITNLEDRLNFYADDHNAPFTNMGPGTVSFLSPGDDVQLLSPGHPTSQYDAFVQAKLREIGAATGVPVEMLEMNFNTSFSASRAAMNMFSANKKMLQDWFVYDFCKPVYDEFLTYLAAKGVLNMPGFFSDPLAKQAYCAATWAGPAELQIDPRQEAQAYAAQIALGATSYSEVAKKYGSDFMQNIALLTEEQKLLDWSQLDRTPLKMSEKRTEGDVDEETAEQIVEGGDSSVKEASSSEDANGDAK
jgi:lambda family phage portal protein